MTGTISAFRTYDGCRTRVLRSDGAGAVFVLLHGFGDSADTWSGVISQLAVHGRAAVAPDLPGFGSADDFPDGDILPQLDRFVAALVDEEARADGVVLVGNSLGALAALRAAGNGVPVAAVVAIAEPSCGDSWAIRQFRKNAEPIWIRALSAPLPVPRVVTSELMARAARRALAGRYGAEARAAARRVGQYFVQRRGGLPWVVQTARKLALESADSGHLEHVTVPVCVVHGLKDRIVPVNSATTVHAAIPHSRLVLEPTWGHSPQLEEPAAVARLLKDFVDSLHPEGQGVFPVLRKDVRSRRHTVVSEGSPRT